MSYHIVSIDSPRCSLSCRDGRLTCRTEEGEKSLPLEDVASIIITSFSASIHSHLFLEAAKHGVALIICSVQTCGPENGEGRRPHGLRPSQVGMFRLRL